MKRNLLVVFCFLLIALSGCKKCYTCANSCKKCHDPNFSILVCSDVLGSKYYKLYIDSLTDPKRGWICNDTISTKSEEVCADKSKTNNKVFQKEEAGYSCK
jgi:hypothetical protein